MVTCQDLCDVRHFRVRHEFMREMHIDKKMVMVYCQCAAIASENMFQVGRFSYDFRSLLGQKILGLRLSELCVMEMTVNSMSKRK